MIKAFLNKSTPTQLIIMGYFFAVIVSTLLLKLPISLKPGIELTWLDAIFTAASGISVTGLGVVSTSDTFSQFGFVVLLFILQFGGIGIMTLGTLLWLVMGRHIGLSQRRLIMIDQNRNNLSGLVRLMQIVLFMAILFEAIGTLIFGTYFLLAGYYLSWQEAYFNGLFHAVSSYTNAGFDIFGDSLIGFSHDYFVQLITMVLLILGAIGFPALIELREYLFGKHKNFRFSLYTKVTTITFFLLLLFGALSILLIENHMYFSHMAWHEKLFYSLFNSTTARNGGLATMDVNDFSEPTQLIMSILMFIGASPSSVGGGIRTTTFAVVMLSLYSFSLGRKDVRVLNRRVSQEDSLNSFFVVTLAIIIVTISIAALLGTEGERFTLMEIVFEVCSAFGTTGLSMGITGELSGLGKIIIINLMFVGRIGILSILFLFRAKMIEAKFRYPEEKIIIG